MNIALLSYEYGAETGPGGIATYSETLGAMLAAQGHRVWVLAASATGEDHAEQDGDVRVLRLVTRSSLPAAPDFWTPPLPAPLTRCLPALRWFHHARTVASRLVALDREVGLDLVEGPEFRAECVAYPLRGRVPLVIRLHTPHFLTRRLNRTTSNFDVGLREWMERQSIVRANAISAPNQTMADLVRKEYHAPKLPIVIFPNPVLPMAAVAPVDWPDTGLRLLYTGRLERRKGVDVLVEAVGLLHRRGVEVSLVCIGGDTRTGPDRGSFRAYLDEIGAREGVSEHIHFLRARTRGSLAGWYASADVCVTPSRYEVFGYSAAEAMAMGKCVVASRTGGLEALIDDGDNGLLTPPGAAAPLADAIERLQDGALRQRLGDAARHAVLERHGPETLGRDIASWYADVAGQRPFVALSTR